MIVRQAHEPLVLVVDDDALIGELVTLNLARSGFQVARAMDGIEALRRLREKTPALMVLDLGLPKLDGFGVLTAIHQRRAIPRLNEARFPVIILTARHSMDDVKRAITLGASDFLAKPFEVSELVRRVREQTSANRSPTSDQ